MDHSSAEQVHAHLSHTGVLHIHPCLRCRRISAKLFFLVVIIFIEPLQHIIPGLSQVPALLLHDA